MGEFERHPAEGRDPVNGVKIAFSARSLTDQSFIKNAGSLSGSKTSYGTAFRWVPACAGMTLSAHNLRTTRAKPTQNQVQKQKSLHKKLSFYTIQNSKNCLLRDNPRTCTPRNTQTYTAKKTKLTLLKSRFSTLSTPLTITTSIINKRTRTPNKQVKQIGANI
jgi:hypothetical protein